MQYRIIAQTNCPVINSLVKNITEYLQNESIQVFSSLVEAINATERIVGYLYSKEIYNVYVAVVQTESCGCNLKIVDVFYLHKTRLTDVICNNYPVINNISYTYDLTEPTHTIYTSAILQSEYDDYSIQMIEPPVYCTMNVNGHHIVLSKAISGSNGNTETIELIAVNNKTSCKTTFTLTINYTN